MTMAVNNSTPHLAAKVADPTRPSDLLVEMRNLGKSYGYFRPFPALQNLNLTVRPGEVVGLLGPNGSGKSTALRLLLGFLRPSQGIVRLAGYDPWTQGALARQAVAYLPGELHLYDNLTLRQMAYFLADLRGAEVELEVRQLADMFSLPLDTPMRHGSSGMRRKAALVALLAPRTPLLVLDEPTNTLDPAMRNALLDLISQGAKQGQGILFSSHVLEEVEAVCHRVIILRKGKLEAQWDGVELRRGRRIRAVLGGPLVGAPPDGFGAMLVVEAGRLNLEVERFGPEVLGWLALQPISDLRIEPLGLGKLYHAIHGAQELGA